MFESIINTISSLGYIGIALLMALENILSPIPSELIMPLAGFTVTQGKLEFIPVVIAGTIGSVLGSTPWYFLGKYWGLKRTKKIADKYGKWLTVSGEDVEKANGIIVRSFKMHDMDFSDELLSGSLSVCSCQGNDCQWLAINKSHRTMPSCKLLESLKSIIHLDKSWFI